MICRLLSGSGLLRVPRITSISCNGSWIVEKELSLPLLRGEVGEQASLLSSTAFLARVLNDSSANENTGFSPVTVLAQTSIHGIWRNLDGSTMKCREQFRAVIVGGGPVGLTAAHSFALAGIDLIVLEARDTCTPDAGSSLVLNPASLRIFHQFGLEDQARKASAEHERALLVGHNGRIRKDVRPFTAFDQR